MVNALLVVTAWREQSLEWTDEGTWLSQGTDIMNTWLWGATQVMPLFGGQLLNRTLDLRLPPMQLLLSDSSFSVMGKDTWEIITQKHTRVIENDDLYAMGYKVKDYDKADKVPTTIKCFHNVVLLGEKSFLVGYEAS